MDHVKKLLSKQLNAQEVQAICNMLFDPQEDVNLKANFLREFHRRGETAEEVALFAEELLKRSTPLPPLPFPTLDVCGTGGDRLGFFNISTTVMFVAAACGAKIVKMGNRSATSQSGGADVLEALGVNLFLPPEKFPAVMEAAGCGFLFAPTYYPIFSSVVDARRLLAKEGSPTLFNFLGPLLNPARPIHQLVGLFEPRFIKNYAHILNLLGRKSAWVVCGETEENEVVDEVSTLGETTVCALHEGQIETFRIHPTTHFGLPLAHKEDLLGGDAQKNAHILVNVLNGSDSSPHRDIVVANTAAALCVCGIATHLQHGVQLALEAITSGEALRRLHTLCLVGNS